MKKQNNLWMHLLLVLVLFLLSGCNMGSTSDDDTVVMTDLIGREVAVPVTVERVVAIGPGALRMIAYAGDLDLVVGVEQMDADSSFGKPYMLANPELAQLPIIGLGGPANAPDAEQLITVAPDVIFSTYALEAAVVDELQTKTGIPVVVITYSMQGFGVTDIFDQIVQDSLRLVGEVCGTQQKAQSAIDVILDAQQDLQDRTANISADDSPSVYVGGLGSKGMHGIESTQGEYMLLDVIQANNVADDTGQRGAVMIDKEQLLAWDPELIFIDLNGYLSVAEDYQKNPTFYNALTAVQNGQVYGLLPYNYYNTNLGTAIADAYYLGSLIHPEAFADLDPIEKADEIYSALLGEAVYAKMAQDFGGFGPLDLGD